jgi:hypothetical protein
MGGHKIHGELRMKVFMLPSSFHKGMSKEKFKNDF